MAVLSGTARRGSPGSAVFRFQRRFAEKSFDYLDVVLAVGLAVAVAETTDTIALDAGRAEIHLRDDDARRLHVDLGDRDRWPKWCIPAELVEGPPDDDSQLTVVLVEREASRPGMTFTCSHCASRMTMYNGPRRTQDPHGNVVRCAEWTLVLCPDCAHLVYADSRLVRGVGEILDRVRDDVSPLAIFDEMCEEPAFSALPLIQIRAVVAGLLTSDQP